MKKYYPAGSLEDPQNVVGYVQAQTMVQVLKQCGDDLTRENVMRQAANLKELPGQRCCSTASPEYQPDRLPADGGDGAAAFQRRTIRSVRRSC